jgi:hypothetical protein
MADAALEAELARQHERHPGRVEAAAARAAEDCEGLIQDAADGALLGHLGHRQGVGRHHLRERRLPRGGGPWRRSAALIELQHPGGVAGDGVQQLLVFLEKGQTALLFPQADDAEQGAVARQDRHQQAETAFGQPAAVLLRQPGERRAAVFEVDLEGFGAARDEAGQRRRAVQPHGAIGRVLEHPGSWIDDQQRDAVEVQGKVRLPRDQLGELGGITDGANALDEHGQDLPRIVLLAEEPPVDPVQQSAAVGEGGHAQARGDEQQDGAAAREELRE